MRATRLVAAWVPLLLLCMACGVDGLNIDNPLGPPSAEEFCRELGLAGVGRNCHRVVPRGASARARERYDFELYSVPGEGGSVMTFETVEDYDATVELYAELALFAGPHRYGNRDALVFVQMNQGASLEHDDLVREMVDAL